MQHIPKQSHYVRCPALELLRIGLCGPLAKSLEIPVSYESVYFEQTIELCSGPKHKEARWPNLCMYSWLVQCLCYGVSAFCGYVFAFGASINF